MNNYCSPTEANSRPFIDLTVSVLDTEVTENLQAETRTRQRGFFVPMFYRFGRVERRNKIPAQAGNMPGAACRASVDTRLPSITSGWELLTKTYKEGVRNGCQ